MTIWPLYYNHATRDERCGATKAPSEAHKLDALKHYHIDCIEVYIVILTAITGGATPQLRQ